MTSVKSAWGTRGYEDAVSRRKQRAPLREDDVAYAAYMTGYRRGLERRATLDRQAASR